MENAKIFIAEDDKSIRVQLSALLNEIGHRVVKAVATPEEALSYTTELQAFPDNLPDVAILDGNLDSISRDCRHGWMISRALKEVSPSTKIIANSAASPDLAAYGDLYIDKTDVDSVRQLLDAIKSF